MRQKHLRWAGIVGANEKAAIAGGLLLQRICENYLCFLAGFSDAVFAVCIVPPVRA